MKSIKNIPLIFNKSKISCEGEYEYSIPKVRCVQITHATSKVHKDSPKENVRSLTLIGGLSGDIYPVHIQ